MDFAWFAGDTVRGELARGELKALRLTAMFWGQVADQWRLHGASGAGIADRHSEAGFAFPRKRVPGDFRNRT